MKTANHKLALKPSREHLISITELRESPLDHIDRVHPAKQCRIRLCDLQRDLSSLTAVASAAQRLLQMRARRLAPGAGLRARRLPQDDNPVGERWRLRQRATQQPRRGPRRPRLHRRLRRLPQARQHPAITRRPHTNQMRSDPPRRRSIGKQQPGGRAMQGVTLIARQRTLERILNHRMNEEQRIVIRQHLRANQSRSHSTGDRHLQASDPRRVPQLATVPEHRQRVRELQRARIQCTNPRQHAPRDSLPTRSQQHPRIQLEQRPLLAPDSSQQLGHIQGIPAGRRPHRRAQLLARPLAERGVNDRADRDFAQQRRAHDRRGLRAQRIKRHPGCDRPTRPQHDQQRQRQTLDSRSEMRQPPKRRLIRPMHIIHSDQHRPAVREIGGQPIEPMQDGKRRVPRGRLADLSQQQRSNRAGRAREQRVTLAHLSARQPALEQLAHYTEREPRLKLRATRSQHLVTQPGCPPARRLQERGLPHARPALDDDSATAPQQLVHRGQLDLALKQPLHDNTLKTEGSLRAHRTLTPPTQRPPRPGVRGHEHEPPGAIRDELLPRSATEAGNPGR